MDEFNQEQDTLLDSALHELPLIPLPADFSRQVMATIHLANAQAAVRDAGQNQPAAAIHFRLQFLDIALALFWSVALTFVWLIILWWTGLLHLDWLPQAQAGFFISDQLSMTNPALLLGGIILLLLEMSLLGLVGVNLWGEQPARRVHSVTSFRKS